MHRVLRLRYLMLLLLFIGLGATVYMYKHVPTAFVPQEDQGYFIIQIQAPQGASLSYTGRLADQAQAVLSQYKEIEGSFAVTGFSFSGSAPNNGIIFAS